MCRLLRSQLTTRSPNSLILLAVYRRKIDQSEETKSGISHYLARRSGIAASPLKS
jgi:hypothetical protein